MDIEEEQKRWAEVGLEFHHYMVELEFEEYYSPSKPLFFTIANNVTV